MEASEPDDDEAWVRELMAEHRDPLVRYLRRFVSSADDVEVIVQETWIAAWQAKQQGECDEWRPWLFRTAHHIAYDHRKWLRRVWKALPIFSAHGWADRDGDLGFSEAWLDIAAAAKTLTTKERHCLFLQAIDGLADDEIAARLRISVSNVRVQRMRARAKLKAALVNKPSRQGGNRSSRGGR